MALRLYVGFALALLVAACGHRDADRASADTVMVFGAAPPSSPQDSNRAPSKEVMTRTMGSYSGKLITADSAAKVIVDYLETHGSFNAALDPDLVNAIKREQRRRAHH